MNTSGTAATTTSVRCSDPSQSTNMTEEKPRPSLVSPTVSDDSSTPSAACSLVVQLTAKVGRSSVQRFGPPPRSNRFEVLNQDEKKVFKKIFKACSNVELTWRLLYVTNFDAKKALQIIQDTDLELWNMQTKVLFKAFEQTESIMPLPRIQTKTATDVIFIYPARFTTSCQVIPMLNYLCQSIWQGNMKAKIGLLFDMKDYTFSFQQIAALSIDQWVALIEWIQQQHIVRTETVLMVNCGKEFLKVWKESLKTQVRSDFKPRFDLISEDARSLHNYLCQGAEQFLPTQLPDGQAATKDLVQDFVQYRKAVEDLMQQEQIPGIEEKKDKDTTSSHKKSSKKKSSKKEKKESTSGGTPAQGELAAEAVGEEKPKKKTSRKEKKEPPDAVTVVQDGVASTAVVLDEPKKESSLGDSSVPTETVVEGLQDKTPNNTDDSLMAVSGHSVAIAPKRRDKKKSKKNRDETSPPSSNSASDDTKDGSKEDNLFVVSSHSVAMAPRRRTKQNSGDDEEEDTLFAVSTHSVAMAPKRKDKVRKSKKKSAKEKESSPESETSSQGTTEETVEATKDCDDVPDEFEVKLDSVMAGEDDDSSTSSFADDMLDSGDEFGEDDATDCDFEAKEMQEELPGSDSTSEPQTRPEEESPSSHDTAPIESVGCGASSKKEKSKGEANAATANAAEEEKALEAAQEEKQPSECNSTNGPTDDNVSTDHPKKEDENPQGRELDDDLVGRAQTDETPVPSVGPDMRQVEEPSKPKDDNSVGDNNVLDGVTRTYENVRTESDDAVQSKNGQGVMTASSLATAVVLQHGRSVSRSSEKSGNNVTSQGTNSIANKPRSLGVTKNLWKSLRTTVSAASSTIEVQLSAKVGSSVVQSFGPYPPKAPIGTRLQALSPVNLISFNEIKKTWLEEWELLHPTETQPWGDSLILRVSEFAEFHLEKSMELMRRMPLSHWSNLENKITAAMLSEDLQCHAVVPLPGVTTKAATDLVYVCPANFTTKSNPLRVLTYTMNSVCDRYGDEQSKCKLALLMNLDEYCFSSKVFPLEDWITWMELIQGQNGPLRVAQVLLVNPSEEFRMVWTVKLRNHCEDGFSWRFNFVEDARELKKFLNSGFEKHLPEELPYGRADAVEVLRDFMTYREALEGILHEQEAAMAAKLQKVKDEASNEEEEEDNKGPSPTAISAPVNRRAFMSRHSSMSNLGTSKRSSKTPIRQCSRRNLNADPSGSEQGSKTSKPAPVSDRRRMLHRSSSVQTISSKAKIGAISEEPSSDRRSMLHRTISTTAMRTKPSRQNATKKKRERKLKTSVQEDAEGALVQKDTPTEDEVNEGPKGSTPPQSNTNVQTNPVSSVSSDNLESNNTQAMERAKSVTDRGIGGPPDTSSSVAEPTDNETYALESGTNVVPDNGCSGEDGSDPKALNSSIDSVYTKKEPSASLSSTTDSSVLAESNSDLGSLEHIADVSKHNDSGTIAKENEKEDIANDGYDKEDCRESNPVNTTEKSGPSLFDTNDILTEEESDSVPSSPDGISETSTRSKEQESAVQPRADSTSDVVSNGEMSSSPVAETMAKGDHNSNFLPVEDGSVENASELDSGGMVSEAIKVSSKATAVLLKHGRSFCGTTADESNESQSEVMKLARLTGKKKLWTSLRNVVSAAASPVEVQLAAQIGNTLAQRYGPYVRKSTLQSQLDTLEPQQKSAFKEIRRTWKEEWSLVHRHDPQPWDDETILRASVFSEFALEESMELLRRMPLEHWHNNVHQLSANKLSEAFLSLSIVPLPCVTTKAAKDVVYVRPSRFSISFHPMRLLTYAMNCLYERHGDKSSKCKLALLMNLKGYRFSSKQQQAFSMDDWISWMELIQGQNGPVKARQILLVNPPKEFVLVFKARLREHCQDGFSWRFNVVEDEMNLDKYLTPGFEEYLPSDFPQGRASVDDLVRDFLKYREALDSILEDPEKKQVFTELDSDEDDSSDSDNDAEACKTVKPAVRIDRRAMMSRHSSLSNMNLSKHTLQASRRRFKADEKTSDLSTSASGRRGLLHRSNSVQTLRSGSENVTGGGLARSSSVRGGFRVLKEDDENTVEGATKEAGEMEAKKGGDDDEGEDEEENGMLQHFERARRRHSLNMNDSGSSHKPRSSRVPSRRHLLHRTNSAQNMSATKTTGP